MVLQSVDDVSNPRDTALSVQAIEQIAPSAHKRRDAVTKAFHPGTRGERRQAD
jgi:hypothetical protein